jgi:hypothetical protein
MKQTVTAGDIALMIECVTAYEWARKTQVGAQHQVFRLLGLKTNNTEPHERWAAVEDMLHGDLTVRQALKKLGVADGSKSTRARVKS